MNTPCLMIAGTHSSVGKTLLTMGLTVTFREKGLTVQVFKVGPDYIDPSYHRAVSGRACFNLDSWMLDREALQKVFLRGCAEADLCLVEGVMGLFDGFSATSEEGSSAEISKIFDIPILLVLDAAKLARSAAAMVKGFTTFDPQLKFAGILLNRVSGEKHASLLKSAIESMTDIPVLGFIPKDKELEIPERHLGLIPAQEFASLEMLSSLKRSVMQYCDVERMIQRANELTQASGAIDADNSSAFRQAPNTVRIAYAWDEAFHFYYQDNLDFLQELGAELVPFSPTHEAQLPDVIHGLYFGGGFPEVFAKALSGNDSMKKAIRTYSGKGIPIYAECGGLMYLSEGITDLEGKFYSMLGLIPGKIEMTSRLQNFGYQSARLIRDSWIGKANGTFRAHEFHYSTWSAPLDSSAHQVKPKRGGDERFEGYLDWHILASYLHLHFLAVPERAVRFIEAARRFSGETR